MAAPVIPFFPPFHWSRVTPFTYPDFMTHTILVESLRKWITDVVVPWLEDQLESVTDELLNDINSLIEQVNSALVEEQEWVTEKIASLEDLVNDAVQQIINSTIEIGDPIVAGILANEDSASARAVRAISAPLTVWVDDYKYSTDVSDSESWQRAIDISRALQDMSYTRIVGRKTEYEFHVPLDYSGLRNCHLSGSLNAKATMRVKPGAGIVANLFGVAPVTGDVPASDITVYSYGDSMAANINWQTTLASDGNVTVVNKGLAGITATETAFIMGALEVSGKFTDNSIDTTGVGTFETITPASQWRATSLTREIPATITDSSSVVHEGFFSFMTTETPTLRFRLNTIPDAPITFPEVVPITVVADAITGVGLENEISIVWEGRNSTNNAADIAIADAAIAAKFTNVFVIGVTNGTNEPYGNAAYTRILAINEAKKNAFKTRYYDPREWFIRSAIYAVNITPTVDDLARMSNDAPPVSVMSPGDEIHFSPEVQVQFGHRIYQEMRARQILSGSLADPVENVRFSNFRLDGGMTSAPDVGIFDRYQDRTWGSDRFQQGITANGDGVPDQTHNAVVSNIELFDNEFIGMYSLPVLLQGVKNVKVHANRFLRCLDVGFTWVEALDVSHNRVEWSADNGLSLSRGCSQVVALGNTIVGSYYSGIHFGGFGGNNGPQDVSIVGNTILTSRQYGISGLDAPQGVVITGNLVDGVLRGDTSANRDTLSDAVGFPFGTGIIVTGKLTNVGTTTPTVDASAMNVLISDNVVMNADRMGILVGGGCSDISVDGNKVLNIGSKYNAGGTIEIVSTHLYYNIGIGIYNPHAATITNVAFIGNMVTDTRAESLINQGVYVSASVSTQRSIANVGSALRNAQPLGSENAAWVAGSPKANGAILAVDSAASTVASLLFRRAGESLFSIRKSTTYALEFYSYLADKVMMKFASTSGEISLDLPSVTGVTANVYLDSNNVLRKVG